MATVLSPLNQAVPPYVFRGGGNSDSDSKNLSSKIVLADNASSVRSPSSKTKTINEGLERINDKFTESPCHEHDATFSKRGRQTYWIGMGNDNDPFKTGTSLTPSPSMRRTRSLPQDEFAILGETLHEFERNDSIMSGKSGR